MFAFEYNVHNMEASLPLFYLKQKYVQKSILWKGDFCFRALGSLVVLSFPQALNFSSVLPNLLAETLTKSSNGCSHQVDR